MKRTRKFLKVIVMAIVITTLFSITAFAGDQGVIVDGINKYPCFTVNNQFVYCAEIQNKVPETGMAYNQVADDTNFSCCDEIFIATKIMNDNSIEYRQVIQQMIWGAINGFKPDASIRKISDTAYAKYQEILTVIENIDDEYIVTYFSYETNEVPASGNAYQKLIGAEVKKIEKPVMMAPAPAPVPPTTEEPTTEEPTVPPVEEVPTEEPTTEEPTTEEPTTEEPTVPPVEEIPTEEPTVVKKVPLNEEAPEFEIPNTGVRGTSVIGIIVFAISMIAIVVIAREKKEKEKIK